MLYVKVEGPTGQMVVAVEDDSTVLCEMRGGRFRAFLPIREAPNLVLFRETVMAGEWLSTADCVVATIVSINDIGDVDMDSSVALGTPIDEMHLCGITHGKHLAYVLVKPIGD